ncbi:hypothetical protein [Streptomyces sp. NBC_00280]|uniref:hypothetical protein n=1 Tax=Streptomyces sp. NBC_00280 TaxID=2975699 RepID=UPI0032482F7A
MDRRKKLANKKKKEAEKKEAEKKTREEAYRWERSATHKVIGSLPSPEKKTIQPKPRPPKPPSIP